MVDVSEWKKETVELVNELNKIEEEMAGGNDKHILWKQLDYIFRNYSVYFYMDAFAKENEIIMKLENGDMIKYDKEEKAWVLFRWG